MHLTGLDANEGTRLTQQFLMINDESLSLRIKTSI